MGQDYRIRPLAVRLTDIDERDLKAEADRFGLTVEHTLAVVMEHVRGLPFGEAVSYLRKTFDPDIPGERRVRPNPWDFIATLH